MFVIERKGVHYSNMYETSTLRYAMSTVKTSAKLIYMFNPQEDDEETASPGTLVFPVNGNVKFNHYCATTITINRESAIQREQQVLYTRDFVDF